MTAVLGLLVWNVFPETAIITCIITIAIISYVLSIIVVATVKRLIGDELLELRLQSNAVANRLEIMDRKVTAILRDALQRCQAENPTLLLEQHLSLATLSNDDQLEQSETASRTRSPPSLALQPSPLTYKAWINAQIQSIGRPAIRRIRSRE